MKEKHPLMEFQIDEHGKEVLLKEGKFQVMMEWEKPYMEACIDALKPFGDILEIGFGLGYSATRIQEHHPKSHTIIEYHPEVAKRARKWAEAFPNVTIIEDTWQNALKTLGTYDCIFFDDYPLYSEAEMIHMEEGVKTSQALIKETETLFTGLHETFPELQTYKYTDEDLRGLILSLNTPQEMSQFLRFLKELEEQKQITKEQLKTQIDSLIKEGKIDEKEAEAALTPSTPPPPENDRLFYFLNECLEKHMRTGSRFSCFLSDSTSKFEDKKFFDTILTNPFVEYHEELIPIEVPSNCRYYHSDTALVITLSKLS